MQEAEPLMRRALAILGHFTALTGHQHPGQKLMENNYHQLLLATGRTQKEADAKVREVMKSSSKKSKPAGGS